MFRHRGRVHKIRVRHPVRLDDVLDNEGLAAVNPFLMLFNEQ
jgi:hypothetical protein